MSWVVRDVLLLLRPTTISFVLPTCVFFLWASTLVLVNSASGGDDIAFALFQIPVECVVIALFLWVFLWRVTTEYKLSACEAITPKLPPLRAVVPFSVVVGVVVAGIPTIVDGGITVLEHAFCMLCTAVLVILLCCFSSRAGVAHARVSLLWTAACVLICLQVGFAILFGLVVAMQKTVVQVFLCAFYPLGIASFKFLAIFCLKRAQGTRALPAAVAQTVDITSLTLAALPYRAIFLGFHSWTAVFVVLSIEVVYKVIKYLFGVTERTKIALSKSFRDTVTKPLFFIVGSFGAENELITQQDTQQASLNSLAKPLPKESQTTEPVPSPPPEDGAASDRQPHTNAQQPNQTQDTAATECTEPSTSAGNPVLDSHQPESLPQDTPPQLTNEPAAATSALPQLPDVPATSPPQIFSPMSDVPVPTMRAPSPPAALSPTSFPDAPTLDMQKVAASPARRGSVDALSKLVQPVFLGTDHESVSLSKRLSSSFFVQQFQDLANTVVVVVAIAFVATDKARFRTVAHTDSIVFAYELVGLVVEVTLTLVLFQAIFRLFGFSDFRPIENGLEIYASNIWLVALAQVVALISVFASLESDVE